MKKFLYFGEKIDGFGVRVLNEREVRASAGILFFFAMIAFLNAWLAGNFYPTKIFVIAFLVDFFVRIFINPKYAPSLIIGRFAVSRQNVEYVGAPQKRFAWGIGFLLALSMFFLVIVNDVIGPINLLICSTCLLFLFFESAFGICIGCKIYNLFHKEKATLCPGGSCAAGKKEAILRISLGQTVIVLLFILVIALVPALRNVSLNKQNVANADVNIQPLGSVSAYECQVPDWAVAIGHAEMWRLHHGCK